MSDLQKLLDAVDELNSEEVRQLYAYLMQTRGTILNTVPAALKTGPRVLGLHSHLAWMSDDFDEELPDSHWFDSDQR